MWLCVFERMRKREREREREREIKKRVFLSFLVFYSTSLSWESERERERETQTQTLPFKITFLLFFLKYSFTLSLSLNVGAKLSGKGLWGGGWFLCSRRQIENIENTLLRARSGSSNVRWTPFYLFVGQMPVSNKVARGSNTGRGC